MRKLGVLLALLALAALASLVLRAPAERGETRPVPGAPAPPVDNGSASIAASSPRLTPGRLEGQVLADGRPVAARLSVLYLRLAAGSDRQTPFAIDQAGAADASGRFELQGLLPGALQVLAEADGYEAGESAVVELPPGGALRDVRIALRRGPAEEAAPPPPQALRSDVFGLVLDPAGQPVGAAYVLLEGERRALRSDAAGRFTLGRAPPGALSVAAAHPRFRAAEPALATAGEEVVLRLGPGGHLSGRVLGPDSAPVEGAAIAISAFRLEGPAPWSRKELPRASSEADGRFDLGDLAPGTYTLVAQASGHAAAEARAELRSGRAVQVVFRLGRGATLSGSVQARGGEPIAGAAVRLFDPFSPFKALETRCDGQGDYVLRQVPAGRRSLRVSARGYLTEVVAGVEIPEDGEAWQDVTLDRARPGQDFSFHGIGAVLKETPAGMRIEETLPGLPAALHGLRTGDLILEVDREPVEGRPLQEVIELIRGQADQAVELEVERDGERLSLELERGRVVVEKEPKSRPKKR